MYGYEGTKKATIATTVTYLKYYGYDCHYSTKKIEAKRNGDIYELYHDGKLVCTSKDPKEIATKMYNSQWKPCQ